jgi:hypothetical protein
MLSRMKRLAATVLVVAALGFLAYATLVPHAERPCLEYTVNGRSECLER